MFHRSFNAMKRATGGMTTSTGIPVTGTYGVLNSLFSVLEKTKYESVIPCAEGGSNWRKRESEDYKGNRESKGIEFYSDLSLLLEEVLPTLGMSVAKSPGYECDDVIATISRNSPAYDEIHILTCDRDLCQLISNKVKVLLFNSAKKMVLADTDWVLENEGVYPSEIKFKKSLCGDKSDNVAGIPKLGPKTAVRIIEESRPKGEDEFLSGADRIAFHPKVSPNAATFYSNLRLVTLENDVPDLAWYSSSAPNPLHVEALLEGLEFKSMLKRKVKILQTLGCPQ